MEIREWHIVISGFQQQSGTINGTVVVWDDLIRITRDKPSARVELLTWCDNVANQAELIKKTEPVDAKPIVNVYGYSWGGMTAANFARELKRRGIEVNHMVLCDAVYRHWYWLGQWRAFVSLWSIQVPDNVLRVTQFRQKENYPRGHKVTADNPGRTDLGPIHWLGVDHCWMDDQPAFRRACRDAALQVRMDAPTEISGS